MSEWKITGLRTAVGMTISLGNYEFIRIDCAVDTQSMVKVPDSLKLTEGDYKKALEALWKLCNDEIEIKLDEIDKKHK